jgi:hypothetical protein
MVLDLGKASVETRAVFCFPQCVFDPVSMTQKPYPIGCVL